MGCGLIKLMNSTSRNHNMIQPTQVVFRVSDLRRIKKRGLYPITEARESQEYSIIEGNSNMRDLRNY